MSRLEQQRAAFALQRVESLQTDHGAAVQAKYKTQLVKLPARLHTNGLGQTVAFYLASGPGSPEVEICGWLEAWLRTAGVYPAGPRLIDCITGADLGERTASDPLELYRQASVEARAVATWLKRFAEAFLQGQGGEDR